MYYIYITSSCLLSYIIMQNVHITFNVHWSYKYMPISTTPLKKNKKIDILLKGSWHLKIYLITSNMIIDCRMVIPCYKT